MNMQEIYESQTKELSTLYKVVLEAERAYNSKKYEFDQYWKPLAVYVMGKMNEEIEKETPCSCCAVYYNQYCFYDEGLQLYNDDEVGRPMKSVEIIWDDLIFYKYFVKD